MDQTQQHQQDIWQGEERRQLSQIELKLIAIQSGIDELRTAFPDGDIRGHCDAHKEMIDAAKAQKAFWNGMKEEIGKRGILAVIILLCGFIWVGLQIKLGLYHPVVK